MSRDGVASTLPMPRDLPPAVRCRCGGWYVDVPLCRDAHGVVFGHQPAGDTSDSGDRAVTPTVTTVPAGQGTSGDSGDTSDKEEA